MSFYSQNGEDCILEMLFSGKEQGFFVEVGCIDGKRFSNTLHFEENGWRGLCIEAHSGYIAQLEQNRPNSIIVHCAIADIDDESVVFYANSRGSLSTLDSSKENEYRNRFGDFFTGFEEQVVRKRTLDNVFSDLNIIGIDILSIDIEGHEVQALRGIDFSRVTPKVMVIESDTKDIESMIDSILLQKGYIKLLKLVENIFYVHQDALASELVSGKYHFPITWTCHPLDGDSNRDEAKICEIEIAVSGNSEYVYSAKRSFLKA